MSLVVLGIVVLGCVFYIFFTLFRYSEKASPLSGRLRDLRIGIEQKKLRLTEYQDRVEMLEEDIPNKRTQYERRERWVELLRDQKARLDAERVRTQKPEPDAREGAIRKGLARRRRRE